MTAETDGTPTVLFPGIEVRRLTPSLAPALAGFLEVIESNGDRRFFHPHPFDPASVARIASFAGRDLYYVVAEGDRILAYGMLRGWDEGFEIPALGMAVHPAARGRGLASGLLHFLHMTARRRNAARVRIKVYPDNIAAVRLYRKFGYVFEGEEAGQRIGFLSL